jgi:hypothetical protein
MSREAVIMTMLSEPRDARTDALRRSAFRPAVIFTACFLGVSALMEVFLATVTAIGIGIDIAVWIRCTLVLGSAILLLLFARRAAAGSRPAWVRLRIISPIVVVAVVVIVSVPGFLPDWVRLEQAVCGALVTPVAVIVNHRRARGLYPEA